MPVYLRAAVITIHRFALADKVFFLKNFSLFQSLLFSRKAP